MQFPYTKAAACALALGALLGLGACSRSQHATAGVAGPGRAGSGPQAGAGCPSFIPNDINTAFNFNVEFGAVVSFRPDKQRLRSEMSGDAAEVSILSCGPCAATDIPNVSFIGGHANVFLHGTSQSVTTTGERLTFGPLLFQGEAGIVLASDAQGNVLEWIWPELAGLGPGSPRLRVELARWNAAMVNPATSVDVTWDVTGVQDGVQTTFKGHCEGMAMDGTPVTPGGSGNIAPCPASIAGTGGSLNLFSADCVQFRARRARFEATGDMASGIVNATGICATADAPGIRFIGGQGNVFQAGSNNSVTATGKALVFAPLVSPVPAEPGVVLATDIAGDVLEIIWPALAGLPPGPPRLRFQLAQWSTWLRTGRNVDVSMTFDAVDAHGGTATFTVSGRNITMPQMK